MDGVVGGGQRHRGGILGGNRYVYQGAGRRGGFGNRGAAIQTAAIDRIAHGRLEGAQAAHEADLFLAAHVLFYGHDLLQGRVALLEPRIDGGDGFVDAAAFPALRVIAYRDGHRLGGAGEIDGRNGNVLTVVPVGQRGEAQRSHGGRAAGIDGVTGGRRRRQGGCECHAGGAKTDGGGRIAGGGIEAEPGIVAGRDGKGSSIERGHQTGGLQARVGRQLGIDGLCQVVAGTGIEPRGIAGRQVDGGNGDGGPSVDGELQVRETRRDRDRKSVV